MRTATLLRALASLACALAAGACTTLAPLSPTTRDSEDCARWFATLDAAVDAAGVRDAQDEPVAGFPGLRVDRWSVATRTSMPFEAWLARAAALDRQAREIEMANLPRAAFPVGAAADAAAAGARSEACREAWPERLAGDAPARAALQARATVPDRYDLSLRLLGLYPLVRWPFFAGVNAWQKEHEQAIARWAASPPALQRFVPADAGAPLVFEIEQHDGGLAPFDRFGVPQWREGDAVPRVDTAHPVVYRRESQTLYGGHVLRQDVFTLWFPERPPAGRFDLLGGALDGVIVRLTYGDDGAVLMLDTIHACGCYHLFFPAAGTALRDGAPRDEEWAFVPGTLPALRPGERLVVRIASATHYVTGIARDDGPRAGIPYTLRDEQQLRSLPLPALAGGGRRSLYGADGLVRGSERAERFLFWPMGIASAGAMRQWGHHATAFVGRRHFDDPNLLDKRFLLSVLPPP